MKVIVDLCVIPLGVGVSVSEYIAACERILNDAGLNTHLHAYGTNIEGEWDEVFDVGVRSCYVASSLAIPLMLKAPEALIVNISFYSFSHDHGRVVYQAAKLSVDKMTYDMARDLRGSKVSCVSLWPGYVRTEGVMRFDTPKTDTESPWYAGRAVVALASDVAVSNRSGQIQLVGELAREYGFVDEDGLQPEPMHQTERGKGLNKTAIERLRGLLK